MNSQKCIVCNCDNPAWPVVDATTGFRFCGGCWQEARNEQNTANCVKAFCDAVSQWLWAIGQARENHI